MTIITELTLLVESVFWTSICNKYTCPQHKNAHKTVKPLLLIRQLDGKTEGRKRRKADGGGRGYNLFGIKLYNEVTVCRARLLLMSNVLTTSS